MVEVKRAVSSLELSLAPTLPDIDHSADACYYTKVLQAMRLVTMSISKPGVAFGVLSAQQTSIKG
jgi:hypothetical protein